MSIVKNSVLAGNGLTADQSSSVVIWPSVVVSGVTYTFCEYITTNETNVPSPGLNNPTYIRDIPHLEIVRPTGHDYYPCYNGSTYGVYDKVNHTFTPKTLYDSTSHGSDQPYGVGIWDLMWATASGYTDLLFLVAADDGTQSYVDAEHPAWDAMTIIETRTPEGGTATQKTISLAFYLSADTPLPPNKVVVESIGGVDTNVTYSYARGYAPSGLNNGELIKGRKPRWNLFADGNPVRTHEYAYPIGVDTYAYKLRYAIFNGTDDILKKWHGYNSNQAHVPFSEFSSDSWPIEFHNGVFVQCQHSAKLVTALSYDNHCIFLYNETVSNMPELHIGLGNLINWDSTIGNQDKVNFYFIRAYVDVPLWSGFTERLIDSSTLYWNGNVNGTPPANGKFGSSTPTEGKLRARDGKNADDSYFNWTNTANVRVIPALYNVLYYATDNKVQGETLVLPQASGAPYGTSHTIEIDEYLVNKPLNIVGNFDPIVNTPPVSSLMGENFRMILRTPTIAFGGTTYNIVNGVYKSGSTASNIFNQFYWLQSAAEYLKSGVGMTFLYATDADAVAPNTNDCICILELTTCATDGTILAYVLLAKHRSQGVYHKLGADPYTVGYHDPDIDYRDSPLTYNSNFSFEPNLLCNAVLPTGTHVLRDMVSGSTDEAKEKAYTNKVMFFYDEFPSFVDSTIVADNTEILRPDTTAVIGMYSDISALVLYGNTTGGTLDIPIKQSGGSDITYRLSVMASIAGIKGNKITLNDNQWLIVYGYNGVLNGSELNSNKIYFKRYAGTDTAIDGGVNPNQATYTMQYALLMTDGVKSQGGYFITDTSDQTGNTWKLHNPYRDSDGVYLDVTYQQKRIYATLKYIRITTDKCFPTPDHKLTDNGIFELNIWSDDIVDLSVIKWSLQKYS